MTILSVFVDDLEYRCEETSTLKYEACDGGTGNRRVVTRSAWVNKYAGTISNETADEVLQAIAEATALVALRNRLFADESPVKSPLQDIASERRRQIHEKGWTPEHDDTHDKGELVRAAICYADPSLVDALWPFVGNFPLGSDRRASLVKAAALLVAEIERLDRAK